MSWNGTEIHLHGYEIILIIHSQFFINFIVGQYSNSYIASDSRKE